MSPPLEHCFAFNPRLNIVGLAESFATSGRIQIADFLTEQSAVLLQSYVDRSDRWRHLLNSDHRNYEFAGDDWDALAAEERTRVARAIDEAAAYGFQYQYDTIRVPDQAKERAQSNSPIAAFASFLSSAPVLDVVGQITGARDIVFADCQATRYRPGDFLTPHNDELDGMHRRLAYVLSLTPDWLPRWGGLLHFVDSDGGVAETMTPRFNALSLFAVGQSHYVSQVATYAPIPRISLTGWLRTRAPD